MNRQKNAEQDEQTNEKRIILGKISENIKLLNCFGKYVKTKQAYWECNRMSTYQETE